MPAVDATLDDEVLPLADIERQLGMKRPTLLKVLKQHEVRVLRPSPRKGVAIAADYRRMVRAMLKTQGGVVQCA